MLPTLTATAWILLMVVAALCGIAKTALPGAATIAVALCTAVLPAKESTGAILLMLMTGDLLAVWSYRRDADFRMLRRLVPAVLAGVGAGALFLHLASNDSTRRLIGVILLALVAITLLQRRRASRSGPDDAPEEQEQLPASTAPTASSRLARLVYGSLAGFTTMVANAGGPVTSMYFLACRYPVKAFLGTTAWFFFLVNLVKLPFSISAGLVNAATLSLAAVAAPVVIVSALVGRRLAERMDQRVFEPIIVVLTIISALPLLR
ncbi:sulfite exporter TauE/SafE family protein [Actinomyces viscosus]|uniref:Probable membrane transporter protein n=1 Tax=Actinomyces viscosus TaxID=1656 RepID=A0A3S4YZI2_ACTVI|nr:sulfite exporter TauE/SafE family protein [Actinomyces viscosus]TFH53088.1 sulfite exporter TauE/SafE family protein [Actinomyces viscosus]VEI14196.1 Sulfite exporter TauE/SafE [Actinomyces viscosus]